jgi:hypothetical protein
MPVKDDTPHLRLRLEPQLLQRLERAREKSGRTLTGEISQRIRESFRKEDTAALVETTATSVLAKVKDAFFDRMRRWEEASARRWEETRRRAIEVLTEDIRELEPLIERDESLRPLVDRMKDVVRVLRLDQGEQGETRQVYEEWLAAQTGRSEQEEQDFDKPDPHQRKLG